MVTNLQTTGRRVILYALVFLATVSCSDHDVWVQAGKIVEGIHQPQFRHTDYSVREFGATEADILPALRSAIRRCSDEGGGRVVIPAGTWFCKGPVHLLSNVNLHFEDGAELVFSTDERDYLPCVLTRWEGTEVFNYSPMIYAYNLHNIAITGNGIINGQGAQNFQNWKAIQKKDQNELRRMGREGVPVHERVFGPGHYLRPAMVELMACSSVLVEGVTIEDGTFWSFHLIGCDNVTVHSISVDCTNLNSDGVDPESSTNVLIEDCYFHTGDDGIAIKSGRDQDGWRLGQPTENIVIRNCTFNTSANGICIGSEISGGVRNVFVEDCNIIHAKQGLYFKSNRDRGGYIENVYVRNISVGRVDANLIQFEPNYKNEGSQYYPTPMKHFVLERIQADTASLCGIQLESFESMPVEDVTIRHLQLEHTPEPVKISHYKDLVLEDVRINGQGVHLPISD